MRHLGSFFYYAKREFCTTKVQCHRLKTSKDRKEHFFSVNSWKVNEQQEQQVFKQERQPKKKVALLLGYNGSAYQGMQANPGIKSIEGELFEALCQTGAVSESNASDPKKVQLMRAARTDKGVHAACNLVSLKMICSQDIVKKLNDLLPNHFRIWGYVETQRSFHAKTKCDSRVYEYLLPSYTLQKPNTIKPLTDTPTTAQDYKVYTENGTVIRYLTPTDAATLNAFRVSPPQLDKFKSAMAMFTGTHNFHNYTRARSFKDPASKRFIMDIQVSDPILIHGTEWVSVKLHGQSFMLHQIRKMILMAMYTVRTDTPLALIEKTFDSTKINIPKAPALGLLLDRPVFQMYNQKMTSLDNRPSIDFDIYKEQVEHFKREFIYKYIFEQEAKTRAFDSFLGEIDSHLKETYAYFNPLASIPDHCVETIKSYNY